MFAKPVIVIIGNKIDLKEQKNIVTHDEGAKLAKELENEYYSDNIIILFGEVSCKNNENVQEIIQKSMDVCVKNLQYCPGCWSINPFYYFI